jgi:hypothetical protein
MYNDMPAYGRKAYIIQSSRDLDKEAEIVQDIEKSRADLVPWFVHTWFSTHLRGLSDAEIMSSYALPPSGDNDDDDDLDVDDYGASWLTDEWDREILAGTYDVLLRQIEGLVYYPGNTYRYSRYIKVKKSY